MGHGGIFFDMESCKTLPNNAWPRKHVQPCSNVSWSSGNVWVSWYVCVSLSPYVCLTQCVYRAGVKNHAQPHAHTSLVQPSLPNLWSELKGPLRWLACCSPYRLLVMMDTFRCLLSSCSAHWHYYWSSMSLSVQHRSMECQYWKWLHALGNGKATWQGQKTEQVP